MKGFKKDGKFRPTGNKSKSSLTKTDIPKRVSTHSGEQRKKQELELVQKDVTGIKPIEFYGKDEKGVVMGTPKDFLELSATGSVITEHQDDPKLIESNTGRINGLSDVHSDDPNSEFSHSSDYQGGGDEIEHQKKRWRIWKSKTDDEKQENYKNFDYGKPKLTKGYNTENKILGTGESNLLYRYEAKDFDEPNPSREIFRGDELGSVEYYKRILRRGEPIYTPELVVEGNKVTTHEGRHRSRAMFEEGIEEIPILINTRGGIEKKLDEIIGEDTSINNENTVVVEDERSPIFGRNKKSVK